MFKKILVAIDRSKIGDVVFNEALDLAKATKAQLMLLHVLSPYEHGYPEISVIATDSAYYLEINNDPVRRYLDQLESFKNEGLKLLRSRVEQAIAESVNAEFIQTPGTPGYAICDIARSWGADLIIMGCRGIFNTLTELTLGSVSHYVSNHAPCSVLVMHPMFTSAETEKIYIETIFS